MSTHTARMSDTEADHFENGTHCLEDNLTTPRDMETLKDYLLLQDGEGWTAEEIRTINRFCYDATMYIQQAYRK